MSEYLNGLIVGAIAGAFIASIIWRIITAKDDEKASPTFTNTNINNNDNSKNTQA